MRIGFKKVLFLVSSAIIFALVTANASSLVSYGTQSKGVSKRTQEGAGFAVAADASGRAIRIYLASYDNLSCLDAQTWKTLWSKRTPYGSIDAGPVISDDMVIYAGGGGAFTIYGISARAGQTLWRKTHTSFWLATAPGMLFADSLGSGVTAFSPRTGKKLWTFGGIGPEQIGKIFYSHGKIFTAGYILDAHTGKLVKRLASSPRAFAASNGRVFGANLNGTLEAWNVASGKVLWLAKTRSATQGIEVAANSGYVFAVFYTGQPFFAHNGVLKAYSALDGRLAWERRLTTKDQALGVDPIGADNLFVYLIEPAETAHGSRIIALDAQTGRLVWSCQTTTKAYGPPVPTRKAVYIAVGNTVLYAIDKHSGRVLRTLRFPK